MKKESEEDSNYISQWDKNILHIWDPLYQQNYYFFYVKTSKEYADICKRRLNWDVESGKEEISGGFNVYRGKRNLRICCIWGFTRRSIIHEGFHAISYVLRDRGVDLTDSSDDAFAYALTFLTEEIFKNLKKKDY
jgi:hypothetical protein